MKINDSMIIKKKIILIIKLIIADLRNLFTGYNILQVDEFSASSILPK